MIACMWFSLSISGLVWFAMVASGFDQLTTINVDTIAAHTIISLITAIYGAFALGACLLATKNNQPLAELRHAQKGNWIFSAFVYAACVTVACAWVTGRLVAATAQHLSGAVHESAAIVTKVWLTQSGRPGCAEEVSVDLLAGSDRATFCVEIGRGKRIAPENLHVQDKVLLRLRQTRLGVVVESVERYVGVS